MTERATSSRPRRDRSTNRRPNVFAMYAAAAVPSTRPSAWSTDHIQFAASLGVGGAAPSADVEVGIDGSYSPAPDRQTPVARQLFPQRGPVAGPVTLTRPPASQLAQYAPLRFQGAGRHQDGPRGHHLDVVIQQPRHVRLVDLLEGAHREPAGRVRARLAPPVLAPPVGNRLGRGLLNAGLGSFGQGGRYAEHSRLTTLVRVLPHDHRHLDPIRLQMLAEMGAPEGRVTGLGDVPHLGQAKVVADRGDRLLAGAVGVRGPALPAEIEIGGLRGAGVVAVDHDVVNDHAQLAGLLEDGLLVLQTALAPELPALRRTVELHVDEDDGHPAIAPLAELAFHLPLHLPAAQL